MIIRPATEADFPQMVSIYNSNDTPPCTLEAYIEETRKRPAHLPYTRLVAICPNGELAGYVGTGQSEDAEIHHFFVYLLVDKSQRGRGIGQALRAAAAEWARGQGAVCLEAAIDDDRAEVLAWARKQGFVTEGHVTKSELQLGAWDPAAYQDLLAPANAHGIRLVTLTDLGVSEENLRCLHQFCLEMQHHVPGRGPHLPHDFGTWREKIKEDPAWDSSCVLLALDGDRWMGVSFMERVRDGSLYTYLTAVHPDYRGKGLGNAIKVAAVQLAKHCGAIYLSTWNHTINAAMLAVNRRLGYQPVEGIYQVHLPL